MSSVSCRGCRRRCCLLPRRQTLRAGPDQLRGKPIRQSNRQSVKEFRLARDDLEHATARPPTCRHFCGRLARPLVAAICTTATLLAALRSWRSPGTTRAVRYSKNLRNCSALALLPAIQSDLMRKRKHCFRQTFKAPSFSEQGKHLFATTS